MGWVEYNGGLVEFSDGAKVDALLVDGRRLLARRAGGLRWGHLQKGTDIRKFRVVEGSVEVAVKGEKSSAETGEVSSPLGVAVSEQRYNPIDVRDRVKVIDETLLTLQNERVELLDALKVAGFLLCPVEEPHTAEQGFLVGDLVELKSTEHTSLTAMAIGERGRVTRFYSVGGSEVVINDHFVVHVDDLVLISR